MTATDKDIGFGFDTTAFTNGIKAVGKGMTSLEKGTEAMAKNMGKSMFWAMAKVQALGAGLKAIGRGVMGVLREFMPEIGQTFSIAREIFFKNFLWPLRQLVAPLLQKMLNWVRDNRAMFVSWGQSAANIFRVVFNVLGTAWTMIRRIWDAISPLFGQGAGGIQQGLNLLVAKIATVTQFLLNMLQPALDWLKGFTTAVANSGIFKSIVDLAVGIGKVAWDAISGFFQGLGPWLIKAVEPFSKIVKALGDIWNAIFGGQDKSINEFFKWIGNAAGWTLVTVLDTVAGILNGIKDTVNGIKEFFSWMDGKRSPTDVGNDAMAGLLGKLKAAKTAADVNKLIDQAMKGLEDKPMAQGEFKKRLASDLPGALKANPALGGLQAQVLYNGFGGPTKDATTLGVPNGVFSVQVEVVDKTAGGVKADAKGQSLPSKINGSVTASGGR